MATIKWLCIIIGALGCGAAAFLQYKKQNEVTVMQPTSGENSKSISAKVEVNENSQAEKEQSSNSPEKNSIRY